MSYRSFLKSRELSSHNRELCPRLISVHNILITSRIDFNKIGTRRNTLRKGKNELCAVDVETPTLRQDDADPGGTLKIMDLLFTV